MGHSGLSNSGGQGSEMLSWKQKDKRTAAFSKLGKSVFLSVVNEQNCDFLL